jgi:Ca2+-binding RTX toxin-like protein
MAVILGNNLPNILFGTNLGDAIVGFDGNDTLGGSTGEDTMYGGFGDDIYIVNSAGDLVGEASAAEGTDTVEASVSYSLTSLGTLGGPPVIFNLPAFSSVAPPTFTGPAIFRLNQKLAYLALESSYAPLTITPLSPLFIENLTLTGTGNINGEGNALANVITGNVGNNILSGLAGNDIFVGSAGNDSVDGGADTDTADYSALGGATPQTITAIFGNTPTVTVAKGALGTDTILNIETLIANAAATDNLLDFGAATGPVNVNLLTGALALAGQTITTVINFDDVDGTVGDDTITGDDQDNALFGDDGNDILNGGDGDDFLDGWEGDDTLDGGDGNDTLLGWFGNDIFVGSAGNDLIDGEADTDTADYSALGGATPETITAIFGNTPTVTVAKGALGTDTILNIETLIANAGAANNLLNFDAATGPVNVNLLTGVLTLAGQTITTVTNFDDVIGTLGDDTITGDGQANSLSGGGGADVIDGGGGADVINGGGGADVINGGGGADVIDGGTEDDVINGGGGADVIDGGAGDDILNGDGGNDRFIGSTGNDAISGGTGTDTADYSNLGGSGANAQAITLQLFVPAGNLQKGPLGADTIFNDIEVIIANAAANNNLIDFDLSPANSVNVNLSTGSVTVGGDSFTVTNFDDVIGTDFNDIIIGDGQANILIGGLGNDSLSGGAGADTLNGGDGTDTLTGGNGADLLIGGLGADIFTGGNGADQFAFTRAQSRSVGDINLSSTASVLDRVTDFNVAQDQFLLSPNAGDYATGALNSVAINTRTFGTLNTFVGLATALNVTFPFTTGSTAGTAQVYDVTVGAGALAGRYLVINNQNALIGFGGFNEDTIIDITGMTGTLSGANFAFGTF